MVRQHGSWCIDVKIIRKRSTIPCRFRIDNFKEKDATVYLEDNLWRYCFDVNQIETVTVDFFIIQRTWQNDEPYTIKEIPTQTLVYKPNLFLNKLTSKFNLILDSYVLEKHD